MNMPGTMMDIANFALLNTNPHTYHTFRSVLIVHTDWQEKFQIEEGVVMQEFCERYFNAVFPESVYLDVKRALEKYASLSYLKEPTSEGIPLEGITISEADGTMDNDEAIAATSTIPFCDVDEDTAGLDFGEDFDWSQPTVHLTLEQEEKVDTWLQTEVIDKYKEASPGSDVELPTTHQGNTFELIDAKDDQRDILAYVLHRVKEWFDNTGTDNYVPEPIRLTIAGVAGSGKSFLTNTLVTALRRIFGSTDSVKVMAPTGEAAYNAGGTTVHHGLGVSVNGDIASSLTNAKKRNSLYRTET